LKINGCETVGSSCLQGLCLDLEAEAEIFYLCSGSGRTVKREMAEQLGAKEATTLLSSQHTDKNKCYAFPFPHTTAHLEHTRTHKHRAHSEDKLMVAPIQLQADESQSFLFCCFVLFCLLGFGILLLLFCLFVCLFSVVLGFELPC
jgi:hypothetical protein